MGSAIANNYRSDNDSPPPVTADVQYFVSQPVYISRASLPYGRGSRLRSCKPPSPSVYRSNQRIYRSSGVYGPNMSRTSQFYVRDFDSSIDILSCCPRYRSSPPREVFPVATITITVCPNGKKRLRLVSQSRDVKGPWNRFLFC